MKSKNQKQKEKTALSLSEVIEYRVEDLNDYSRVFLEKELFGYYNYHQNSTSVADSLTDIISWITNYDDFFRNRDRDPLPNTSEVVSTLSALRYFLKFMTMRSSLSNTKMKEEDYMNLSLLLTEVCRNIATILAMLKLEKEEQSRMGNDRDEGSSGERENETFSRSPFGRGK